MYTPEHPPINPSPSQLAEWAMRELRRVQSELAQVHDHEIDHANMDRPAEGMARYFDGTDYNPGGGAGLYEYTGGGTNGWRMLSSGVQY
jgi:hypothetical protein